MTYPRKPRATRTNFNISEDLRILLALLGDGRMVTGLEKIKLLVSLLAQSHPTLQQGSPRDRKIAKQIESLKILDIYQDSKGCL